MYTGLIVRTSSVNNSSFTRTNNTQWNNIVFNQQRFINISVTLKNSCTLSTSFNNCNTDVVK